MGNSNHAADEAAQSGLSDNPVDFRKSKQYGFHSKTVVRGFFTRFTIVERGDSDLYFARLNLVTGKFGEGNQSRNRYQSVDVLVGSQLVRLAERAIELARMDSVEACSIDYEHALFPFKEMRACFTIEDLHFIPVLVPGEEGRDKAFLNSRGLLTELSFGQSTSDFAIA